MKKTAVNILIVFLACLTGFGIAYSQDIQVSVGFNQDYAIENQEIMLTVTVEGSSAREASAPALPDFGEWFSFGGSRGTSQNISIVNGRVSASISYNYSLIPLKAGNSTIPAVEVRFQNKIYKSEQFNIEIKVAGSAPPANARQQRRTNPRSGSTNNEPLDLFMRAEPEKNSVYKNEGVTVLYKVYAGSGVNIADYTPLNLPNFPGFWTEEYTMSGNRTLRNERYNGKNYRAAVLMKIELYPTRTGELALDPIQMEFRASRTRSTRSRNLRSFLNDPFFDRPSPVRVASNNLNIIVKPLPEAGKPANFDGLVGRYDLTADVDVRRVKANESVTLKVDISGTGNIKLIGEPDIRISGVYEKYDPTVNESINRRGGSITGTKSFEYVIIPRTEGELRIDPIVLSYFDPETETYRSARTAPISIIVEEGDRTYSESPVIRRGEEVRLVGTDIRFIKESVKDWLISEESFYVNIPFIIMIVLPLMLVGVMFLYSRHVDKLSADIGYKRSRQANTIAVKRMKKAKKYLDEEDAEKFYPEIAKGLQDYIADKVNISAAGILTDELENILINKKIDTDLIGKYISCLQKCDFHRFSSAGINKESMAELYEESKEAIIAMEERLKKAA
ncbi:MAG: protein BatD [bacterium]|nr:protein BatD [bacterium]